MIEIVKFKLSIILKMFGGVIYIAPFTDGDEDDGPLYHAVQATTDRPLMLEALEPWGSPEAAQDSLDAWAKDDGIPIYGYVLLSSIRVPDEGIPDNAIFDAIHVRENAAERWALRKTEGMTDEELQQALAGEITGEVLPAHLDSGMTEVPLFQRVRDIMNIPYPAADQPQPAEPPAEAASAFARPLYDLLTVGGPNGRFVHHNDLGANLCTVAEKDDAKRRVKCSWKRGKTVQTGWIEERFLIERCELYVEGVTEEPKAVADVKLSEVITDQDRVIFKGGGQEHKPIQVLAVEPEKRRVQIPGGHIGFDQLDQKYEIYEGESQE